MSTDIERVEAAINTVIEWAKTSATKAPTTNEAGAFGAVELVARNTRSRIRMRLEEARAHRELFPSQVLNGITNELHDLVLTCQRLGLPVSPTLHDVIYAGRRAGVLG